MDLHIRAGSPDSSILAVNLGKRYGSGATATTALQNVNFEVKKGEFVSIIGPSGSGKTTLLNLLGALDRPTTGKVYIDGTDVSELPNAELARVRNRKLGFVFQDFNLISRMSAGENVELPLLIEGVPKGERARRARALLDRFGLGEKFDRNVSKLSGGEKQRVAVARALANDPAIVLADEPTGNLDTKNTEVMMEFMKQLNAEFGKTVVVITHNPEVARRAEKLIAIRDGQIEREEVLN
jgi:putative ABC transport system ATP-binding protein